MENWQDMTDKSFSKESGENIFYGVMYIQRILQWITTVKAKLSKTMWGTEWSYMQWLIQKIDTVDLKLFRPF